MPPSDLPALHTFAAVAQFGSFRKAARDLGLSPSAVSHAVSGLEARLGLQLLHRTTRRVSLTQEGRVLLNGLSPALERIDKALDAARCVGPGLAGSLRIAAPRAAADALLVPLILTFRTRFPQVDVTLETRDDPRAGASGDPDNSGASGHDFEVRYGQSCDSGMAAAVIGHASRWVLVAAPAYASAAGLPADPEDLQDHVCIGQVTGTGEIAPWTFRRREQRISVAPAPLLAFDDVALVVRAVRAGAGIGRGLEHGLRADLEARRLVEVLPDWAEPAERCCLCWPLHLADRPVNQAFIEFVRRAGQGAPVWHSRRAGDGAAAGARAGSDDGADDGARDGADDGAGRSGLRARLTDD